MSSTPTPRLLALGGGGFANAIEDWPLDEYVLTLSRRATPRVCLLPTASGDPQEQIERFYRAYEPLGCELSHVSLFRLGDRAIDLRGHLLSRDIVYVGGGSMKNLLALWAVHGVDELLKEAWGHGVALAGVSAGAMCWFEAAITRTHGAPGPGRGLALIPASLSVHDSSDRLRRAAYREAIAAGMPPGYAIDDGVALLFEGTRFAEAVTSRAGARAARVELTQDGVVERLIEPRLLAADGVPEQAEPVSISEFREAAQRRSSASRNSLRSRPPV